MHDNNVRIVQFHDQVIIANVQSGAWAKINGVDKNVSHLSIIDFIEEYVKDAYHKRELFQLIKDDSAIDTRINIYFILTDRCNLHCRTCCVDAKTTNEKLTASNKMQECLIKVARANPRNLILTGGEPLLIENLPELLYLIRDYYNGRVVLQTNGTLMNKSMATVIRETVNSVEISLDGASEETVASIRGKGVFAKCIAAIKLLQQVGVNDIITSCVFVRNDPRLVAEYVQLNKALGTKYMLRAFEPVGRGAKYAAEIGHSFLDYQGTNSLINRTKQEKVALRRTLKARLACGAGSTMLGITWDGYIYPCPNLLKESVRLGHLDNHNIMEINQAENWDLIINLFNREKHPSCGKCNIRYFCSVCLGERSENFDRNCSSQKNGINEFLWD